MNIFNIDNYESLQQQLKQNKRNYVFIYKSNSELSECAFDSIKKVENIDKIKIFGIDVNFVKDIHAKYGVTSAPSLLEFENDRFINTIKGCNTPNYYKTVFEGNAFVSVSAEGEQKQQKRVTVYSTPSCSWCNKLKQYFRENNIKFNDIDVSKDQKAAEEMVKRSGQQGVPQTDINGQIIIGFDKKRIDQLLDIKNN